ncbi:MAG: hypothetical protein FJ088_04060, partial [Deltaproteobacteria bacterium]|nr:hypothetical protein [Deltaproteobacteria bacterium]
MRTPLVEIKPPGIYSETGDRKYTPINLGKTGVCGFIGLTEKGPSNRPVPIASFQQFREIFGYLPYESYLDRSVEGFFKNGGRECYILRVAHFFERGRGEVAKKATARAQDRGGKSTIQFSATSEGIWGNNVKLYMRQQAPKVQTLLTLDIREGDTEATLKSTHGFKRGSIIKFSENGKASYRIFYNLSGKTVFFTEPIDAGFSSSAPTYIEPLEFEVTAVTPDRKEVFKDLSMAPGSNNYFERVINQNSRLINAFNLNSDSPLPDNYPVDFEGLLSGGADGLFNVSPDDFIGMSLSPEDRYGLAAFETIDGIDVIACPDLMWCMRNSRNFATKKDVEVVQHALIDHCEKLKNRVVLLDFPDPSDPVAALQWRLLFDSSYAAFYFPWI